MIRVLKRDFFNEAAICRIKYPEKPERHKIHHGRLGFTADLTFSFGCKLTIELYFSEATEVTVFK